MYSVVVKGFDVVLLHTALTSLIPRGLLGFQPCWDLDSISIV
jgi:hypothetical protein